MPVQFGGEVDHETRELTTGYYELSKLSSREGSGDIKLTTAGGQESTFEIPARPLNLARSVLRFAYTPTSSGANHYNKIFMDCLSMIRTIELRTRSGWFLANIQHVGNYTKIVWKPETSYQQLQTMDNHGAGVGSGSMLQKCNVSNKDGISMTNRIMTNFSAAAGAAGTDAKYPTTQLADNTAANVIGALNLAVQNVRSLVNQPGIQAQRHLSNFNTFNSNGGDYVNMSYEEPKYFEGGVVNSATPVINVKIPLAMLYVSIFEIDKTIGFNEIIDMRIVWESTPKTFFFGTAATSVATDATEATVGATVSDLNLFLAVEKDPGVIQGIQNKIESGGLKIMTNYVYAFKNPRSNVYQNFNLKFDSGHGKRLRKIYTAAFNSIENKNTAYDNDNRIDKNNVDPERKINSKKIKTYYTTLDGTRIQQFDVDTKNNEDYMMLKDKLKGSSILNEDVYHYNWFHVDAWDNNRPLHSKDQNELSGLSLSTERRWESVTTTPGDDLNHYTFAIVQREIYVKGIAMSIDLPI